MEGVITTAARHLMAAGLSGEALLAALADIERAMGAGTPKDDAAEKRRAYDRERKRKAKAEKSTGIPPEKNGIPAEERNSTGNTAVASRPLPPNENNSNPPTPTHGNIPPHAREAIPFDAHVDAWRAWLASKPKTRKRKGQIDAVDRPVDVAEEVWSDFLKHRAKHDADVTATALKGFRREADRVGWSLQRAIEESILRGWRGFKAEWVRDNDRGNRAGSGSRYQPDGALAYMQHEMGLD